MLHSPNLFPLSWFAAGAFVLILASLGSALYFMMHDRGTTKRMVYALAIRVAISAALFLFIIVASVKGWIHSTGIV